MLDGDWTRPALSGTNDNPAPAIVISIGYGDDKEISKAARAYDYTPQIVPGRSEFDPRVPSWRSGGADAFLDFLRTRLLPDALTDRSADMSRLTLFGHSYGGLCALYDLLTRPRFFTRYAIASPSLWWRDGYMLDTASTGAVPPGAVLPGAILPGAALPEALPFDTGLARELLVLAGEQEQWHFQPAGPDGSPQSRTGGVSTLPAMRQLVQTVQARGIAKADLAIFPNMGHGEMLRASVHRALQFCLRSAE
jgi:predicted alpha/beta superfamily hydrolase